MGNIGSIVNILNFDNIGNFGNVGNVGNIGIVGNICNIANIGDIGNIGNIVYSRNVPEGCFEKIFGKFSQRVFFYKGFLESFSRKIFQHVLFKVLSNFLKENLSTNLY